MKQSFRIGRIFGIDIFIDTSWFIIFILFTWTMASSYFPQRFPEWPSPRLWLFGALTSLLLFASVLGHELAHSLVAKRQGEEVRNITLFILGGVAQISDEPKQPAREFVMALAGPMASLGIAFLAMMVSFLINDWSPAWGAVTLYLSLLNVALAVFNLLPGFPMDGGRVLRSVIWSFTDDLEKATKIASRVGQVIAVFFVFLGVLQVLRGFLTGFWMIFIGWFLHNAAIRGYTQVRYRSALKGVKAADLMAREFEAVPGWISVRALVDEFILKQGDRAYLVTDGESIQGVVCLGDVKALPRSEWDITSVKMVMTPRDKLSSVGLDTDGEDVLRRMTEGNLHDIPVMDGDRVAGIICRSDLLRNIQLRSELKE
jgi:Zn-dependent protease/CBS domain-containing protein